MKKIVLILFASIIALVLLWCILQRDEVSEHFYTTYQNATNIDDYCGINNDYILEIEIDESRIVLWLIKDETQKWSGKLTLYKLREKVEEIPVVLEGDAIIIQSNPQKVVSTEVFFFKSFNVDYCEISETSSKVPFEPYLEEVVGTYSNAQIKDYMKLLYEELISNFLSFDKSKTYFEAVDNLSGFKYYRYIANPEKTGHQLYFLFGAQQEENKGMIDYGDAEMILTEKSPSVW